MKGMTKATCLAFEQLATEELTKVLGEPKDFYGDNDGKCLEWIMPYGKTGQVTFHLFCDSKQVGHHYRASWLAGRLSDRQRLVGDDGYTRARNSIEGGWPFPFTYPSGKYNFHPGYTDTPDKMRRDLAHYLYCISAPNSIEKEKFGSIDFEVNNG